MSAALPRRLLATSACAFFVLIFVAFVLWERPGLGIGHFYYPAIALLALAAGPRIGAAGGLLATALYALAIALTPRIATSDVITVGMAIRAMTFVSMGALVGWFASDHRRLVNELQILVQRDQLTGLPNTRAFEAAMSRRFESARPFALLIGDMDALMQINHDRGRAHGNDVLRALADRLTASLGPEDEIARVGGDEFAVISTVSTTEHAAQLAARLERAASEQDSPITFGWSSFPQDGDNALSLYRAADERLYARKLIRGRRLGDGVVQLRALDGSR